MATKKISELEAITEADDSDVLAIVDVSEGKTNKITKNNLLIGAGHSIEMSLNENYQIVLKLKNTEGTELSTASIDLPNENSITDISYNNGKLTLTKQSGTTTEVDITGLINGLVTESDFSTFTTQLNQVLQELDETKADAEDVEALQTRVTELEQENEDLKNNQLTNTPEVATSHYLQDSADARFRKFIPIGRTIQESTTGKNLLPQGINYTESFSNRTITSKDGIYSITGTGGGTSQKINLIEGYTIQSGDYLHIMNDNITFEILGYKSNGDRIFDIVANVTNRIISLENYVGTTLSSFAFYINNNQTNTFKLTPMIVNNISTATDYEPYTGGGPAPNPNYPIAIKNTGDNGSVNEKVQNKNLFNKDWFVLNKVLNTTTGQITDSTSNNYYGIEDFIYFEFLAGETISLSQKLTIACYDKDKRFIKVIKQVDTPTAIVPAETKFIRADVHKDYYDVIQLELGSTATDYVPHSEQNISFSLAQGQKFYEGEELKDNGKDDIWEEKVYDGSDDEGWTLQSSSSSSTRTVFKSQINGINNYTNNQDIPNLCSSHFIPVSQVTTWKNGNISRSVNSNSIYLIMQANMTVNDLKSYLAEQYANGTPVTIVYKKANPTITPYTEEQQQYYDEHIKPLRTYKNVTHISSEDETPANVEIEYVQDTKTYIDNKVTALTNAIISLGGNV